MTLCLGVSGSPLPAWEDVESESNSLGILAVCLQRRQGAGRELMCSCNTEDSALLAQSLILELILDLDADSNLHKCLML